MNDKITSNKITSDEVEITLKDFFRVLKKNMRLFIIAFIIIFVTGIIYSVIVAPQYGVSSQIKLNDSDIYYNNDIYKYFPQVTFPPKISPL
jgi:capsular polysaccharide biosynthesis protein